MNQQNKGTGLKYITVLFSTAVLFISGEALSQTITPVNEVEGLFYTVQLGNFSSREIPQEYSDMGDILVEDLLTGEYRFSAGIFREMEFARTRKNELEDEGYGGVFVIAYEDGKRVSLRELRKRMTDDEEDSGELKMPVFIAEEAEADAPPEANDLKFDFEIADGNILSEAAREVSDLFENQILDYRRETQTPDTEEVRHLFDLNFDTVSRFGMDSLLMKEQISRLKNDWGLSFNTWYIYNLEPGLGTVEEVFYEQRLNLTLQMNVLRNGYLQNKKRAEKMEKELEIKRILDKQENERERYEDLYNYIIYIHNVEKLKKIDERIKLLNRKKLILEMLYTGKARTWEDLIDTKSDISRTQSMYTKWHNYNNILSNEILGGHDVDFGISAAKLPVLKPVPDSLFGSNQNQRDTAGQRIMELQRQIVDIEQNKTKDIALRPFARYSIIGDDGEAIDRTFPSIGLSMDIPIVWKGRSGLTRAKKDYLESTTYRKHKNDNHELLNYYYDYEYQLEQLYSYYHTRSKIDERLRKQIILYQYNDPAFSPLTAIQYMDEMLSVETEMIDIKQNLYLKLLKMMEYVESPNPLLFTEEIDPQKMTKKYEQERDFYCWSDFFYSRDNLFLIHYLKVNEARRLYLSVGTEIQQRKVEDFIKLARKFDVSVHGMVGNNAMALDVDQEVIKEYVERFHMLGFEGVHFDIEPQTFPDWDENKDVYLNNMIETFRLAKGFCDEHGLKLSASIPTYYPEEYLPQLYANLDLVYLMAYERPDIEFIARKTKEEFNYNREKTVLSLRTKDFTNRLIMEKFIEAITETMEIDEVAVHDLGTLFELDYETSFGK